MARGPNPPPGSPPRGQPQRKNYTNGKWVNNATGQVIGTSRSEDRKPRPTKNLYAKRPASRARPTPRSR